MIKKNINYTLSDSASNFTDRCPNPIISVIVPLFHGLKHIKNLCSNIADAARQLPFDCSIEVIFVNDCPEETINIDFSCLPFSVTMLTHPVNKGIQSARISGLQASSGEYVLFLDQDDYIAESYFISQLNAVKDYDVCISQGYRIYKDDAPKTQFYSNSICKLAGKLLSSKKSYIYGTDMIFSPGQCLIRKTSIPYLWTTTLLTHNGCDDFFLWLLMFENGCKFIYNPNTCYYHVESENNYSGAKDKMILSFASMIDALKSCGYPDKYIVTLERRLAIKKNRHNPPKIMLLFSTNPKIAYYTFLYKLAGYH